jgi:phage portal protein BeeE
MTAGSLTVPKDAQAETADKQSNRIFFMLERYFNYFSVTNMTMPA